MSVAALIVAAGRGTRAASDDAVPKQYAMLGSRSVLARSIEAFARHPAIDRVAAVIHPDDRAAYDAVDRSLGADIRAKLLPPAFGGASRQDSVRLGLEALAANPPHQVLIHDAARPFVSADTIDRVLVALETAPGAIAAVPMSDTLKRAGSNGHIASTVDRAGLWRAQTPQGFRFDEIRSAHARAHAASIAGGQGARAAGSFTDDAAIAEWAGIAVTLVNGGDRNVKITTAEDLVVARTLMERSGKQMRIETRTASGFDVHRFVPGSSVWLCGVQIPHTARLEGHSDADVALHALTDALLGTIGAGDIGQHFPPSDMKWKDAASHIFLRHAAGLVRERGGRIVNADITILAEAPRVSPHREAMCARVAEILNVELERVSVKATTTEGLGFTGRREGIAAMATASVELPVGPAT